MSGVDAMARWKSLKQRLSFKALGCCGASWSSPPTIRNIMEQEEEEEEQPIIVQHQGSDQPTSVATMMGSSGMNLATALAAERNLRRSNVGPTMTKNVGQPVKTLMRLIEETEGVDFMRKKKRTENDEHRIITKKPEEHELENDWVCCVCMERSKGAAFIPCGHTFCRGCSREMWLNRGYCPICNRSIVEILDLF